jgi:hypothetical protein
LLAVEEDGSTTHLFATPPVARGALFGIRDGFAGLALQVDDPRRTQIVLVAMGDGRASGIEVGEFGADGPHGAVWLP